MRKLILLCMLFFLTQISRAEFYVVYFTHKTQSTPIHFSIENTQRHHRQNLTYDEKDAPVSFEQIIQVERIGARVIGSSRWLNAICIEASAEQNNSIIQLPFVAKTELLNARNGGISRICETDPGIGLSSERQLQQLQLDRLHVAGFTGKGLTIAVIDNGFTKVDELGPYRHLFDEQRIRQCRNFVDPNRTVYQMGSDGEHGSRVLSVLAALMPPNFVGAAYDANYLLAVTEDMTREGELEEWNWLMAAEWADSLGADILSTSLGYAVNFTYGNDHIFEELDGKTTIISRAANLAASRGMLVVNAMGNEGNSVWKHMNAPADADSCLAVGSVNSEEQYSSFSSIGPTFDGRIKPDVCAMGEFTITVLPQGWLKTGVGTSFACPMMAGFAACVWQIDPSLTNMELFHLIKQNGHMAKNPNNQIGWGIPRGDSIYYQLSGKHLPLAGSNKNYFEIYPNPGHGIFNLSYYNYDPAFNCRIRLINSIGEEVHQYEVFLRDGFQVYSLDLRELHLAQGMYYFQVEGIGSEIILEKKLIILD